jgi:hypothetical protein
MRGCGQKRLVSSTQVKNPTFGPRRVPTDAASLPRGGLKVETGRPFWKFGSYRSICDPTTLAASRQRRSPAGHETAAGGSAPLAAIRRSGECVRRRRQNWLPGRRPGTG